MATQGAEVPTDSFAHLIEIPECELVEAVFDDALLARVVGVPPSIRSSYDVRHCVPAQELGLDKRTFGDADALLIESDRPDRASAVEFKRVKAAPGESARDGLNKLQELRKAVWQANALHAAGFCYVWLTVIIVADVRAVTRGVTYSFTPADIVERVVDAIPLERLRQGIGVTVCEITQVSDRPANLRGGAGGRLLRKAAERVQPSSLTEAIARLFLPRAIPSAV